MSCRPTRPTCTLPSQVITALHPGLRSLLSPRGLIFALFSCVCFRAAQGQQCGSVQLLQVSPHPAAAVPQRQVPHQPRLLHCAAFQPCTGARFLLLLPLLPLLCSPPTSSFLQYHTVVFVVEKCKHSLQTADHIHSLRDCMKMIRGLETGYASF